MILSSDMRHLLVKLNKVRMTMVHTKMKTIGLTGPQILILREVLHSEARTIGDVSRAVELSKSTVSGIVDRLERANLVHRHRDEKDRRVNWIRPTERCKFIISHVDQWHADFYEELHTTFSSEQLALLKDMLEKLLSYLDNKLREHNETKS